jgi:hypothetical protein
MITDTARLQWNGDGLHLDGKGRAVVTIVRDEQYPFMWRVRYPDGRRTDMINRTRAKDAALSIALRILNSSKRAAA